ncbi:conserved exported hypothetical protein [Candidatus Accumulibacter aalborgensis]|uniref:ABC-type transport auxiliary lipoprotein component domain-containing protein n=1 Tax=Candidatus Accumulibacter aalborgensis TaxID=1860102 RepID=A0A1A8XFL8_9PROT|nr:PqiC family protein [Candidatus Accumulibacter aalborgensis]SBT03506.1 conserved exported hypothetical protein [Candidatus Accumulibacter aalborgensis]
MHRLTTFATACILAAMAAACASPPSQFYTLNSTATLATTGSVVSVAVGPVVVPAVVDCPQIVLTMGANQLRVDEFNRWASPLAENITQVVIADLVRELGTARVWAQAQTALAKPDFQVTVDVQRFDSVLGEAVEIDALWTVRAAAGGATRSGRSQVRELAAGAGFAPLVAAHSRALARVSGDIATAIRAP